MNTFISFMVCFGMFGVPFFFLGMYAQRIIYRKRPLLTKYQCRALLSVLFDYGFSLTNDSDDYISVGSRIQEAVEYVKITYDGRQ